MSFAREGLIIVLQDGRSAEVYHFAEGQETTAAAEGQINGAEATQPEQPDPAPVEQSPEVAPSGEQEQAEESHEHEGENLLTPETGAILDGRYRVQELLPLRGFSSSTILAQDTQQSNTPVVIKSLRKTLSECGLHEARILGSLSHKHIVMVMDCFLYRDHLCIVLERLSNKPLDQAFKNICSGMTTVEILQQLQTVASILLDVVRYMHQNAVIHADLKPDNILLQTESDLHTLKVIDFGNAVTYIPSNKFLVTTPEYRAPEVYFGVPYGPQVDLWAIGCILAELYLGEPVFTGMTNGGILSKMRDMLGPIHYELYQHGWWYPEYEGLTVNDPEAADNEFHRLLRCLDPTQRRSAQVLNFALFLKGLLDYDPSTRLSPTSALRHYFLKKQQKTGYDWY